MHSLIFFHNQVNPLITKLSCWNFNLVNADHFSCEYLVCLLCYWSQICVLLRQWVAAIAHTQVSRYAPPTSKVKPIKCNDLVKFCSKLVLWGWILKSTHNQQWFWWVQNVVQIIENARKCVSEHPEAIKCLNFLGSHFVFLKMLWNLHWSHRNAEANTFSAGGAPKTGQFFAVICILQFGSILGYFSTFSWSYGVWSMYVAKRRQ